MLHKLKIKQCYLYHILEGIKTFEIRKNDRDFQVGDTIQFLPIESYDYNIFEHTSPIPLFGLTAPIPEFKINYVLAAFSGLQQNHVCLAITPILPITEPIK